MGALLGRWIEWLATGGVLPTDGDEERLRKAILTFVASASAALAVPCGCIYLALGLPVTAAIPLTYAAISALSLARFFATKRYVVFRSSQLCLFLVLPFLAQWSLGGFAAGSGVMLFALFAPLGALMILGARASVRWFVAYLALIVLSGLLEPVLAQRAADMPPIFNAMFFVVNVAGVSAIAYLLLWYFAGRLHEERERAEELLLNVLPAPIAARLKKNPGLIADGFPEATVLFADVVDFTRLSAGMRPEDVVALLNDLFSSFDQLAAKHGVEKIKTIGDAYMAVGGLPWPRPDHVEAVADMALDLQADVAGRTRPDGGPLRLRIGINTGPVVAGVIGTRKFIYDLWGDAVNTASRMEAHGVPAGIQVTQATYERLKKRYTFEPRGMVEVKGKGPMAVYLLSGRREIAIPERAPVAPARVAPAS